MHFVSPGDQDIANVGERRLLGASPARSPKEPHAELAHSSSALFRAAADSRRDILAASRTGQSAPYHVCANGAVISHDTLMTIPREVPIAGNRYDPRRARPAHITGCRSPNVPHPDLVR